MSAPEAGTPIVSGNTLSAMAAAFLGDLASGKYDQQVAVVEGWLKEASLAIPALVAIEKGLEVLLVVNKATAPMSGLVSDEQGGWVPKGQVARNPFDPKTGKFL